MMEALGRLGFSVEAFTGTVLELGQEIDPDTWLASRGVPFETCGSDAWSLEACGLRADVPAHYRMCVRNVPVTLHRSVASRPHAPSDSEQEDFLKLYESVLKRFQPDVLVNYGGDLLAQEVRVRAREKGAAVLFALHNFNYPTRDPFATVDSIFVPSRFASEYYRKALGLECSVLPNLLNLERARARNHERRYLTFVNPSIEKGVFAFARIADELGRHRPDIPLLIVESRGTEATLVACGIDLRVHGNVFLMTQTPDPQDFWGVTKLCLMPSLWWENQPLVAIEAMVNGVPVIGSNRGGIPETLGAAGMVLPLPERLTPATQLLPTPEEVAPWVEAIVRLWDDEELYAEHERRAMAESRRWAPEILEPRYIEFFSSLQPGAKSVLGVPSAGDNAVALVPDVDGVSWECERALQRLKEAGVWVTQRHADSDWDATRNVLLSDALHDGFEAILLIDPNTGFDPLAALRLLARPEPVIVGIGTALGGDREDVVFAPGITTVHVGPGALGMYPVERAGAAFVRIRAEALQTADRRARPAALQQESRAGNLAVLSGDGGSRGRG